MSLPPPSPSSGPSPHAYRALARWLWPFTRGARGTLTWTLLGLAVMLAAQAVIPLQVEGILHHGVWDPAALGILVVLVIVMLLAAHFSHLGAHRIKMVTGTHLRQSLFGRLLDSRHLTMSGLGRSSSVSRHTSDVENVTAGLESTLASGMPGVARLLISLVLLATLNPGAAVVMALASALFVITQTFLGRRLVRADMAKLSAQTRVGQAVDETITGSRALIGLHALPWARHRFDDANVQLQHREHDLGQAITRLVSGAHAAGMLGLLGVIGFAFFGGHDSMAAVAASLLYVEGAVRSLEAMPPWVRSLDLAVASKRRIDQILSDEPRSPAPPVSDELARHQGMIGLVTTADVDADDVLAAFAESTGAMHVPADTLAFDASPIEYLRVSAPEMTDAEAVQLLESVGLSSLTQRLDVPIGPSGAGLNTHERQRLGLAIAMDSDNARLAVGPLTALADPDTAAPLLSAIRARCATSIVAMRHPSLASHMDVMVFATTTRIVSGTHEQLLVDEPEYAQLWQARLHSGDVDLGTLGLGEDAERTLNTRLVTERYLPGEVIYRQGDLADRVVFIISGRVEVLTLDAIGDQRRTATLGHGSHCGDLRLTVGERRAESVVAIDDTVTRTLSREAISAGMMGLLDRSQAERRIVTSILRDGPANSTSLRERLPELDDAEFDRALDLLRRDGAIRDDDGTLSVVQRRSVKAGARDLLDRLGDL